MARDKPHGKRTTKAEEENFRVIKYTRKRKDYARVGYARSVADVEVWEGRDPSKEHGWMLVIHPCMAAAAVREEIIEDVGINNITFVHSENTRVLISKLYEYRAIAEYAGVFRRDNKWTPRKTYEGREEQENPWWPILVEAVRDCIGDKAAERQDVALGKVILERTDESTRYTKVRTATGLILYIVRHQDGHVCTHRCQEGADADYFRRAQIAGQLRIKYEV